MEQPSSVVAGIAALLASGNLWLLGLWAALGAWFLFRDWLTLAKDESALDTLRTLTQGANGANHDGKKEIQGKLAAWAQEHSSTSMARWVFTVHNAVTAGGKGDTSALADSVWSQERERHYQFRFFARNAIMLGLLLTSAGLCRTLLEVQPALSAKATREDVWIAGIQHALSGALGGMSTAFYSSLFGILISLGLHLAALFLLTGRHERYLNRLDSFLQGSLVPIYTAVIERDRNDVIREMLQRTETSFQDIQGHFRQIVQQNQEQYQDLSEFRHSLATTVRALDKQLLIFGDEVTRLTESNQHTLKASAGISQAVEHGLGMLASAHQQNLEQHTAFREEVVQPFVGQVLHQFESQQSASERIVGELGQASQEFRSLAERIASQIQQAHEDLTTRHAHFEAMLSQLIQVGDSQATQIHGFLSQLEVLMQDQQSSLGQAIFDQRETLETVRRVIDGFSMSSSDIQRQLEEIYQIHRQEVSRLYEGVSEHLSTIMERVMTEAGGQYTRALSGALTASVAETRDKVMGLGSMLEALNQHHAQSVEAFERLRNAIAVNETELNRELTERRQVLERLLDRQGALLHQSIADRAGEVMGTMAEAQITSLAQQEAQLEKLNETFKYRWDQILRALEALLATEAMPA